MKTDPATGRFKGFAFIVFDSAETSDKITEVKEHTINSKKVDPKKKPKQDMVKILLVDLSQN